MVYKSAREEIVEILDRLKGVRIQWAMIVTQTSTLRLTPDHTDEEYEQFLERLSSCFYDNDAKAETDPVGGYVWLTDNSFLERVILKSKDSFYYAWTRRRESFVIAARESLVDARLQEKEKEIKNLEDTVQGQERLLRINQAKVEAYDKVWEENKTFAEEIKSLQLQVDKRTKQLNCLVNLLTPKELKKVRKLLDL